MVRLLTAGLALASLFFAHSSFAQRPELPLEAFAKPGQFSNIKISPDGRYLAATRRNDEGYVGLTILNREQMEVSAIIEGGDGQSILQFWWANDERLILTMAREQGALEQPIPTGEIYGIDADGSQRFILTGPRARDRQLSIASLVDMMPEEEDWVLIQTRPFLEEEPFIDLYRMNVESGRKIRRGRIPLRAYQGGSVGVLTDADSEPRLAFGMNPEKPDQVQFLVRDKGDDDWRELLTQVADEPGFTPLAFSADPNILIGQSDENSSTSGLATLDIRTGKTETLALHPKVDLAPIMNTGGGMSREVVGAFYEWDGVNAVFFDDVNDVQFSRTLEAFIKIFPNQQVQLTSSTEDNRLHVLRVSGANTPATFYIYDNEARRLAPLAESRPWLKKAALAQTQTYFYDTNDGVTIEAMLTLPPNGKAEQLPLILLPHGGPHGVRDSILNMDMDAKVLAQAGYAVLQPNFRGSGGYGRDFQSAGYKQWGTRMIDDMLNGIDALVADGTVNPEQVCIYGASYGGYAAAMASIRAPERFKCAIGFVGVYDLDLLFTTGDIPESGFGQNYLQRVLPDEAVERAQQSPALRAEEMTVPILLIHGGQDNRAPIIHAERLRQGLEQHNKVFEWMVKENEGHGFYRPEHNIERWQKMLAFIEKHLNS
ncbi:alpha/beta hydrolase family protein [Pseudidiomarina taiwanensis]|uniref:S9 family peptidase n=1 Tax=Pseudidiomarina taiwanensis TaxID=337250 RepID=A0A432ZK66_9GAMM|nr:S9 family peptidase [Pseudidiomarina taiwanensis]RUO78361.1 S9 family peptidase [Pseudidiomarina taiwanensis]